jgi:HlyD family secretion protein
MSKKKIGIILGIVALVVLVVVASVVKSGAKGSEVEAVKVAKGDVSPMVTADGLVTAKDTVNLSSQVMGEIVSIPFQEGARVQKGDVLVQINPDTYQRDVASAKANLDASMVAENQAKLTMTQRQRDWDRAEDLFKQNIFSTSQRDDAKLALDQARLSADSARAMAQQARAYFQKAQDNLAKTTMRSPIDGVVTAVNAKEGETAVMGTMNFAGTVILTVSDLSQIITEVQVDEADYPRLRLGQPVIVIVDALGGKKYEGKVIEIGASAQASSAGSQANIRQFKVKVAITSADEQLRPGVTARVKLIADKRVGVLRVPIGAIRTEEKSGEQVFFVFLDKQGKAAKKVVKAGLSDDLYTEVTEGLAQDDVVIIGPYRVLRLLAEGDKVKTKILKAEELEKKQKSDEVEVHVS